MTEKPESVPSAVEVVEKAKISKPKIAKPAPKARVSSSPPPAASPSAEQPKPKAESFTDALMREAGWSVE